MALIDEIIKIQITRDNVGITRVGFGTALILGETKETFPNIVVSYTNLAEVLVDFAANTPEYIMASKLFGQTFKPEKILIAQKADSDTLLDAYILAQTYNDDFYATVISSNETEDILAMAAQVETESRILALSSQQVDIITDEDDNILQQLHNLNYVRTFLFYHQNANTLRPESALLGKMLPTTPGSETWAYKTLNGVTASDLNALYRSMLRLNKGVFYSTLAGVDVTFDGYMVGGEYIDVIHGLDWMEQFIKENIASLFINSGKIPYNNNGIGLIENSLRASLQEAVNRGIINEGFTITTPDVLTISNTNKSNRILPDVFFDATLTGAIQGINQITGTVSV
jgi:hypothetical protein